MQQLADVYARSLFEVASEHDVLDDVHEQLGEFADAFEEERDLRVFFFSPYFSSDEKIEGLEKVVEGADERLLNFLELLAEKHRLPYLPRIRSRFDKLWAEERQLINVDITSAVELDKSTVRSIGQRIEKDTGRSVELSASVDPEVLGGLVIRVGNMVMDASVRNRLERLRSEVGSGT